MISLCIWYAIDLNNFIRLVDVIFHLSNYKLRDNNLIITCIREPSAGKVHPVCSWCKILQWYIRLRLVNQYNHGWIWAIFEKCVFIKCIWSMAIHGFIAYPSQLGEFYFTFSGILRHTKMFWGIEGLVFILFLMTLLQCKFSQNDIYIYIWKGLNLKSF